MHVHTVYDRLKCSSEIGERVFYYLNAIEIRPLICEFVKDRCKFFSDGRMIAEVLRVLTACDTAGRDHYPTTLFTAGEAYAGSCTAKTTIYCANIAAGTTLAQFREYLEPDVQLNLLSAELAVTP